MNPKKNYLSSTGRNPVILFQLLPDLPPFTLFTRIPSSLPLQTMQGTGPAHSSGKRFLVL